MWYKCSMNVQQVVEDKFQQSYNSANRCLAGFQRDLQNVPENDAIFADARAAWCIRIVRSLLLEAFQEGSETESMELSEFFDHASHKLRDDPHYVSAKKLLFWRSQGNISKVLRPSNYEIESMIRTSLAEIKKTLFCPGELSKKKRSPSQRELSPLEEKAFRKKLDAKKSQKKKEGHEEPAISEALLYVERLAKTFNRPNLRQ